MKRHAFVLQLQADCLPTDVFRGRVEHVRSGQATHFESLAELIQFLARSVDNEKRMEEQEREAMDESR